VGCLRQHPLSLASLTGARTCSTSAGGTAAADSSGAAGGSACSSGSAAALPLPLPPLPRPLPLALLAALGASALRLLLLAPVWPTAAAAAAACSRYTAMLMSLRGIETHSAAYDCGASPHTQLCIQPLNSSIHKTVLLAWRHAGCCCQSTALLKDAPVAAHLGATARLPRQK